MMSPRLHGLLAAVVIASSVAVSGSAGPGANGTTPMPPDPALLASARAGDAVAGELLFNRDLLAALGAEHAGNLIVSGPSVFDVLALLAPGARGTSSAELRTALHASSTSERLLTDMVGLEQELGIEDATLSLARAAWLQSGFSIHDAYASLLNRAGAPPQSVDFVGAPEAARQTINQWVEARTRGRIPDLLPEGMVGPDTRLALTSAMALDARWVTPFDHSSTGKSPFQTPSGEHQVSMMRASGPTDYASGPGFTAVRLPYQGGRLDALVVLPKPGVDPLTLVPRLREITAQMNNTPVALALPRFMASSSLDLAPAMGALGLGALFTTSADFSGIGGAPGYLLVSGAVHRTWLSVDEDGTQAAAATGLTMVATSARSAPLRFSADRPFLFVVQDRSHGVPLLVARITDPG